MARKGKELIISLETNQDITLEITRFSKKAETFSEFTGITPVLKQKKSIVGEDRRWTKVYLTDRRILQTVN